MQLHAHGPDPGRGRLPAGWTVYPDVGGGDRRVQCGFALLHPTINQPRDVAHLAPGTRLGLAVEMQGRARLRRQLEPGVRLVADQVHHLGVAVARRRAERPAGDGTDVILELAHHARLDGPVAAVVHPRRDLV